MSALGFRSQKSKLTLLELIFQTAGASLIGQRQSIVKGGFWWLVVVVGVVGGGSWW